MDFLHSEVNNFTALGMGKLNYICNISCTSWRRLFLNKSGNFIILGKWQYDFLLFWCSSCISGKNSSLLGKCLVMKLNEIVCISIYLRCSKKIVPANLMILAIAWNHLQLCGIIAIEQNFDTIIYILGYLLYIYRVWSIRFDNFLIRSYSIGILECRNCDELAHEVCNSSHHLFVVIVYLRMQYYLRFSSEDKLILKRMKWIFREWRMRVGCPISLDNRKDIDYFSSISVCTLSIVVVGCTLLLDEARCKN